MTEALERAARAVGEVVGYRGDDIITKDSLAMDIARAVLMAVRVPSSDVVESGMIAGEFSGMADVAFTAMIDAILNEEKTND